MTSDCSSGKEHTFAGIKVLVVHKEDQVIYKLPEDLKTTAMDNKQREEILSEIKALYFKNHNLMIDTPSEPNILIKIKENKKQEKYVNSLAVPMKRSMITDDLKRNSGENNPNQEENTESAHLKNTRKYIKTGKYSKKNNNIQLGQNLEGAKNIALPLEKKHQPQQSQFTTTPHGLSPFSLSEEQVQNNNEIKKRFSDCLKQDHHVVTNPDSQRPFTSIQDAVSRLLPYHIYHYPSHDLNANVVPLDLQDRRTIDIVRAQGHMFQRYNSITKQVNEVDRCTLLYIKRQIVSDQKQSLQGELFKIAKRCIQSQQQSA